MAYGDKKEFEGRAYAGMRVGGVHRWTYPDGLWNEKKVSPSRWELTFTSHKQRRNKAPTGSGAGIGSGYHWLILGHQWVRKLDANTYATVLEGEKHLLGFQKPDWELWNTQFRNQPDARGKAIRILRQALAVLEANEERPLEEPWDLGAFGRVGFDEEALEVLRPLVPQEMLPGASRGSR